MSTQKGTNPARYEVKSVVFFNSGSLKNIFTYSAGSEEIFGGEKLAQPCFLPSSTGMLWSFMMSAQQRSTKGS